MSKGTPLIVGIGKSITDENDQIQSLPILSHAKMIWFCLGAWLSLARAPGSGPGGRRFKCSRPDLQSSFASIDCGHHGGRSHLAFKLTGGSTGGAQLLERGSFHCGLDALVCRMNVAA